jgi:hypothetical protein
MSWSEVSELDQEEEEEVDLAPDAAQLVLLVVYLEHLVTPTHPLSNPFVKQRRFPFRHILPSSPHQSSMGVPLPRPSIPL